MTRPAISQVPLDQYRKNLQAIVSALVCFYPGAKTVLVSGPAVVKLSSGGGPTQNWQSMLK